MARGTWSLNKKAMNYGTLNIERPTLNIEFEGVLGGFNECIIYSDLNYKIENLSAY
jgi:hypothetical protein